MTIKVGINGFGRTGRMALRAVVQDFDNIEVVAINGTQDPDYLVYMAKYDSVHGHFKGTIEHQNGHLIVNGKKIRLTAERNPELLDWAAAGVDVVVAGSYVFGNADYSKAIKSLQV